MHRVGEVGIRECHAAAHDVAHAVVGGKQYLAVTTGQGGFHAASYAVLVPELVSPPDRGAMLWVFELP